MRLLFCKTCRTVDEVPDYEGHSTVDPIVEDLVMKHVQRDVLAHCPDNPISVFRLSGVVSDHEWATDREGVLARAKEQNKGTGFDAWAYEAMNTYQADAMRCYNDHHRPQQGCIDFWDDSKRLGRPTAEGRHVIKENYKMGKADPHLCQFCVVFSHVQTEIRWKKGAYK